MSILCIGLVLFGVIIVAFTVYALAMSVFRSSLQQLSHLGSTNSAAKRNSVSQNFNPYPAATFKYKERLESMETPSEKECIVCLSDFENDEYVRQLSQCRHSFHAPCINMWLYSHSDCPLCRTPIHRLASDDGGPTSMASDNGGSTRPTSDYGGPTREFTIENSLDGLLLNIRIS